MSRQFRRPLIAAFASLAATLGMMSAGLTSAESAPRSNSVAVAAPVPTITWTRCTDFNHAFCAVVDVPLDYDDPTGPTTQIDVVKIPALEGTGKLGTLFVNPGGPGGSARGFAPFAADLLGDTVALHYDVIGIDPRGVGPSSQMVCQKELPFPRTSGFFPITELQSYAYWAQGRFFNEACRDAPNAIVDHMSTADTARDMDFVREAIGEAKLNYYGISYGTYLGAVYAALFPDRVGRFVVDGVLDPVNWATGDGTNGSQPFTTRIRSARGSYKALISGLAECDRLGPAKCAFAGDSLVKWRKLLARAKAEKLTFFGDKLPLSVLIGFVAGELYAQDYTFLGFLLTDVYAQNFGGPVGRPNAEVARLTVADLRDRAADVIRAPYLARMINAGDPFLGVGCSDTQNPTYRSAWWNAGQAQDEDYPWFGSFWTWASAPCGGFGDFVTTPANPILVVGNKFDPATPIHGARKFASLFAGSRLLTLDGWGHGAIGNTCVTAAFDALYATGALPAEGTVCQPDAPLFNGDQFRFRVQSWRPQAPE
jgi:pimeloyl-ACP methyl ester carboxylesterase